MAWNYDIKVAERKKKQQLALWKKLVKNHMLIFNCIPRVSGVFGETKVRVAACPLRLFPVRFAWWFIAHC